MMRVMSPRLSSLRILIAVVAWLAQLCLPAAHAASMAAAGAGAATWCGKSLSPALQAQIAALPPEIRHILEEGASKGERTSECAQLCVTSGGLAPPVSLSPTVALRAAGIEAVAAGPTPSQRPALGAPLPARGPPARA